MAEQSSTVTAFRALVMLVCLILIPVAAFCGMSFPAVVKSIQAGRWPTLADFRGPSAQPPKQPAEVPRYSPPAPQNGDSREAGSSGRTGGLETRQADAARAEVQQANYIAPVSRQNDIASFDKPDSSTSFPQNQDRVARGLSGAGQGSGDRTALEESGRTTNDKYSQEGKSASASENQLANVVNRLHEMGVTYFVLEPCSDKKDSYRFFCKMSIGGNPQVTRPFWSLDSDPLKAMTRVLRQVEDWKNGVNGMIATGH
jgi:hypothetical protein